mgnify:CR=1 FL=1
MSQDRILAVKEDYLGRVIFNNHEKHNAVSHAVWIALAKTMNAIDADDDVRVIVLEGAGDRAFLAKLVMAMGNEGANFGTLTARGRDQPSLVGYRLKEGIKKPVLCVEGGPV